MAIRKVDPLIAFHLAATSLMTCFLEVDQVVVSFHVCVTSFHLMFRFVQQIMRSA